MTRRDANAAAVLLAALVLLFAAIGRDRRPRPLFEDATERAGLRGNEARHVLFADLDGDGWPDAILARSRVLRNRGGRFEPRGELPPADVVQVADVDADGAPDVFLGRPGGLEVRAGPDYERVLWRAPGEAPISALFCDVDADGRLDLFVAQTYVQYGKSLEAFPDRLYRGLGDGRFEDVTERAGLLGVAEIERPDSRRPSYGVAHTDWNDDGRQDLLVMTYGRQANRLWRNDGDGTFTDVAPETTFDGDAERSGVYPPGVKRETERPFRTHGNTFDCAVADFDGDGDMDCFLGEIAHAWAGPSSDRSMLLENLGPAAGYRFARRPVAIPRPAPTGERWNQGDMHAGWLDVENDGHLDLLIASADYPDEQLLRLYRQRPEGGFEDWTDRLGVRHRNATQISLADYDRDGATDILVGTGTNRLPAELAATHDRNVRLLRNRAARDAGNTFLSLRLTGRGGSNRDAIGARVTIWIGGRRQTREVYGGLGHAGHRDDLEVRFGCGRARVVDRLDVRWPDASGTTQVFKRVPTGRFYALEQGGELRGERR